MIIYYIYIYQYVSRDTKTNGRGFFIVVIGRVNPNFGGHSSMVSNQLFMVRIGIDFFGLDKNNDNIIYRMYHHKSPPFPQYNGTINSLIDVINDAATTLQLRAFNY